LPVLEVLPVPQLFLGPLLHAGGVDPTGWLWSDWNVEPTIAIGLLALVAVYLYLTRQVEPKTASPTAQSPHSQSHSHEIPHPNPSPCAQGEGLSAPRAVSGRQKASFIAGVVVLFIALGPPLDDWSDHYLLLAHMVQHLLLIMLAAPLLLIGTPAWLLEPLTRNRVSNAIGYVLTRPIVAFAVANSVFVLWHLPVLYEMALRSQPVHVLEHMTMIGTAILAWWPIVGPLPQWPRLPLALQSLYFFAMTIPGSAVGAFITFADPGLYTPYDTARRIFGIDLATDQQAAGLLMWVAVSAIYLLLITFSFFRWASREEAADAEAAPAERPAARSAPADPGARATS
jgi:putative membrane protein